MHSAVKSCDSHHLLPSLISVSLFSIAASQPPPQHSCPCIISMQFSFFCSSLGAHVTTRVISKLNHFPCLQYFITIWKKQINPAVRKFQDLPLPLIPARLHTTFHLVPLSRPEVFSSRSSFSFPSMCPQLHAAP